MNESMIELVNEPGSECIMGVNGRGRKQEEAGVSVLALVTVNDIRKGLYRIIMH